jgi:hypothetical protein
VRETSRIAPAAGQRMTARPEFAASRGSIIKAFSARLCRPNMLYPLV